MLKLMEVERRIRNPLLKMRKAVKHYVHKEVALAASKSLFSK